MKRKAVGYLLISLPFIAILIWGYAMDFLSEVLLAFAMAIIIMVVTGIGCYLISD